MKGNRNSLVGENVNSRKLIPVVFAITFMMLTGTLIMAGSFSVASSSSTSSSSSVTTTSAIRIKESVDISATNAAATGITVTNNDVAFIEFVADVGDEVIVKFDVINESSSALATTVTISADANTIASVDEANSTFVSIRLLDDNKWQASFPAGATAGGSATLALSIAVIEPGVHTVTTTIATT